MLLPNPMQKLERLKIIHEFARGLAEERAKQFWGPTPLDLNNNPHAHAANSARTSLRLTYKNAAARIYVCRRDNQVKAEEFGEWGNPSGRLLAVPPK